MGYLPGNSDIFAWAEQQQISCCFLVGVQVTNTPTPGYYVGELSIGAKGYEFRSIKLTQNTTGKTWVSVYMSLADEWVWTDWIPYATATPPQEYDLPLAEGWSGTAKYYKTQENVCVVSLDISKNSELTTGESVGIVPAGFRPAYVKMSPASTFAPSGSTTIGVSTDGSILLGDVFGQEQARNVYATIIFISN